MAHLPVPIARVRHALRTFLAARRAEGDLPEGALLLVACSGGADSLALAAQLAFLAPRMGLRAGLVTVDHGLQQGSAQQARRVAELGAGMGLEPIIVKTASGSMHPSGGGPEGHARDLRYELLNEALADVGAHAILLGHTMEDQAETVLLGLLRGSGTRALAGMRAVFGSRWRPLLGVRREDTEGTCGELDLPVWEDPTNAPDGPWLTADGSALPRSALRHHLLPALRQALGQDPVPSLARTAELAEADADLLEALAGEHFPHIEVDSHGAGGHGSGVSIAVEDLTGLPRALRLRVLREFLIRAGAPAGDLAAVHIAGVDALVTNWRGQGGASVPGGIHVERYYGRLVTVTPPLLERT